ncbi:MAG: nucleoside phosphorylase [Clostridia bacterium]|nr:nucleoside phosphorylase [Clostridia bacterium]
MSIIKNEIPILEYDDDPSAVILPTHEKLALHLPEQAVFAFLGEHIDRYAEIHGARQVATFVSATKQYPVYVTEHKGKEVVLCQAPVGASAAAQILDWLIGYGAKKIVSTGTCGALEHFPENTFLVPSKALRDEGASYHYAPPSRYVTVSTEARRGIKRALTAHGLKYQEVIAWSTDGFYRETKEKVMYRRAEGCSVVEMECSALAACAALRGAVWGEILFTADTLADVEKYDERNWGGDSFAYALELCLDAALEI